MKKKTNTKKVTKSVTFTHEQSLTLSNNVDNIAEMINSLIVDLEDGTISPLDTVSVLLDIRYDVDQIDRSYIEQLPTKKKKVKVKK